MTSLKLKLADTLQSAVLILAVALGTSVNPAVADTAWHKLELQGDYVLAQQKLLSAEDMYRQAVGAIERVPHTDTDLVRVIEKLASTLTLEDKTEEAIRLYQKSLKILEKKNGKNSAQLLPTIVALGSIFESAGDHQIAMDFYRRVLSINESTYGPISPGVAKALHRLGVVKFNAGHVEEAEHDYKNSLAILMQQPGLNASNELESLLNDYNDLLRKKDSTDSDLVSDFESEFMKDHHPPAPGSRIPMSSWQRQLNARVSKEVSTQSNISQNVLQRGFTDPMSNADLAPAYRELSDVLTTQAPSQDNEGRFERMIAIDIKTLGPNHPTVADDLTGLASLYLAEGRYDDAKPLLERALVIYKQAYGDDNLLVIKAKTQLAQAEQATGKSGLASMLYGNVASDTALALKPNTMETAQILNDMANLYYREGKLQDSSTMYQWALSSTEAAVGAQSPLVAACLSDYARVLTALGQVADANQKRARALEILAKQTHSGMFDQQSTSGLIR